MTLPFPNKNYQIIYADPPWDYKGQLQHAGPKKNNTGGAIKHYNTMTLKELKLLPISTITEKDCLLFMWSSSPHLDQAIELGKSWGFKWATVGFIWHKQKTNPGFYTLSQCELCLIFKKGKIPTPRGARNIRQFLSVQRGKHSTKPEEIRNRITKMFPTQSKIELFARTIHPNWDYWGNELLAPPV